MTNATAANNKATRYLETHRFASLAIVRAECKDVCTRADKLSGMNERDRFLQSTRSFFAAYLDRIQTMSEPQVMAALRACKGARDSQDETLAFLKSVSLGPAEDDGDGINQLRSQLNSPMRSLANPFFVSDHIQEALKKRLETLRKNSQ